MLINREEFLGKLSSVSKVANFKDAKGVVKFKVVNEVMHLMGADGSNTVNTTIKVENVSDVESGTVYYVNSGDIINYVKNLGAFETEVIELKVVNDLLLEIVTGNAKYGVNMLAIENYPLSPSFNLKEMGTSYMISVDGAFTNAVKNVSRTIFGNESRPVFNFAHCSISAGNKMQLFSTDGVRCTKQVIECKVTNKETGEVSSEFEADFLIDPVLVRPLISNGNIEIFLSEEHIYIIDKTTIITLKKSNLQYPVDIMNVVFPEVDFSEKKFPYQTLVDLSGEELNNALNLARAISFEKKEKVCKISLSAEGALLLIKNKSAESVINIKANVVGQHIDICLDLNKLDVLQNGIENMRIGFTGDRNSFVIHNNDEVKDFTYLCSVLPIDPKTWK